MHQEIEKALVAAVNQLVSEGCLSNSSVPITVHPAPKKIPGDYATNLALVLASSTELTPLDIAGRLKDALPSYVWLEKVEVVPPGFINFYCRDEAILNIISTVLQQGERFGADSLIEEEKGKKVLVEYVSANPTGPLHIGHGRAAALGSALVNLMNFVGYEAQGEYYVNDSGRQIKILTATLCVRLATTDSLPEGFYQGQYLVELAHKWQSANHITLPTNEIRALLAASMDKEERLDKVIELLEESLGEEFSSVKNFILDYIIGLIKQDLKKFRVHHSSWYFESEIIKKMEYLITDLWKRKLLYDKQEALWFRSKKFGDDKDRVLQRGNKQLTYFAYDIAYHSDKYKRGYDRIVDLLGADHHGYMSRIRASMKALDRDPQAFDIVLVQLVFLINDAEGRFSMSTRADRFIALDELIDLLNVDVIRFFFLMHKADQHLNFDLDIALSQTKDNPVYYVQYAYARISSLFAEWESKGRDWREERQQGLKSLQLLTDKQELNLARLLNQFPRLLGDIARNYEVHQLTFYLRELASEFHSYYNRIRVLGTDAVSSRLCLCAAVKQTLENGLKLLGVSTPSKM